MLVSLNLGSKLTGESYSLIGETCFAQLYRNERVLICPH